MASIEHRGNVWRLVWRFDGRKETISWDSEIQAVSAKRMIEKAGHQLTSQQLWTRITGETEPIRQATNQVVPTLREWVDIWLEAKTRLGRGSRSRYRSQMDNQILPDLGDLRLNEIEGIHVARLVNRLKAIPFANSTITRYFAALHGALNYAVLEEKIPSNPARRIGFVRDDVDEEDTSDDGEDHVYLTQAEYELLLTHTPPDALPLVMFLAETGTRISEALAVHVRDLHINVRPYTVRIRQAWKDDGHGHEFLGTTKGRNRRTVSLPDSVVDELRALVDGRDADELVFRAPGGGRIIYKHFRNRRFDPAVAAAQRCAEHPPEPPVKGRSGPARKLRIDELSTCACTSRLRRRLTIHDLRHSHVAWLLEAGFDIYVISRRLGHKSVKVTQDTYAGILESVNDAIAVALDRLRGTHTSRSRAHNTGSSFVEDEHEHVTGAATPPVHPRGGGSGHGHVSTSARRRGTRRQVRARPAGRPTVDDPGTGRTVDHPTHRQDRRTH